MQVRRIGVVAAVVFAAEPLYAHGEEVLVFPASLALLLVLAIAICIVPWHRILARLITAAVLLSVNVALWFLPVFPQTVGGFAGYNLRKALFILLSIPLAFAIVAGWVFRRVMKGAA